MSLFRPPDFLNPSSPVMCEWCGWRGVRCQTNEGEFCCMICPECIAPVFLIPDGADE